MKRTGIIAVALLTVLFFFGPAHAERLRIGVLLYSPYVTTDSSGELTGPLPELVRWSLSQIGHEANFITLPFARGVSWLESGRLDAFFPFFKTPERESFAIFPKEPIGALVMSLYAKPELAGKFDGDFTNLAGLSVARVRSTLQSPAFDQAVKDKVLKEVSVDGIEQQFQMLAHGRVDLAIADQLAARVIMSDQGITKKVVELKPPVIVREIYLAFSRKGEWVDLASRFSDSVNKFPGLEN